MQDTNPLLPIPREDSPQNSGAGSIRKSTVAGADEAADLIRQKLARIYAEEPDPLAEERKAETAQPRSKHQEFMYQLSVSGKSLAEIHAAWHAYYTNLPDDEKHRVWREFYETNDRQRQQRQPAGATAQNAHRVERIQPAGLSQAYRQPQQPLPTPSAKPIFPRFDFDVARTFRKVQRYLPTVDQRTADQVRKAIRSKVTANGKLKTRHHLQSLGFGLAIGLVTIIIMLFSFFNEVIIAPFIQPARAYSATPIIIDPSAVTASTTPEIIIPKINLEIPVDFTQTSDSEDVIQNALQNGIVHYPSTVMPGQTGNAAFFGHSSNNILNPGKYKFAFILLHELQPGDTFYITYNGKVYIYKVFDRKVVEPSDVGVLDNVSGHAATATLITCDPPGTALHRLVVVGDQISPDPATNGSGTNTITTAPSAPAELPDNGPAWWQNILHSLFGV